MKEAKRAISMKSDIFGGGAVSYSCQRFWAFTLAEMMVVLLILSIVLAAMAPIMTTRIKRDTAGSGLSGSSSVWQWAENKVDAYFGSEENPTAMIGQREVVAGDPSARLIINTSDTRPNHILFKKGNDVLGRLSLFSNEILLGRDNTITEGADNFISLGHNTTVGDSSLTIGNGASASTLGIAIGNSYNTPTTSYNSASAGVLAVAIGTASVSSDAGVAIGSGANSDIEGVVIGNNAATVNNGYTPEKSIVIGNEAKIEGAQYGIAIGEGANITRSRAGNANHPDYGAIAIGRSAKVYNSVSSGSGKFQSLYQGAIAIGRKAEAQEFETTDGRTDTSFYTAHSSIAVGAGAKAQGGAIAIGSEARGILGNVYVSGTHGAIANELSIAIGPRAYAGSTVGKYVDCFNSKADERAPCGHAWRSDYSAVAVGLSAFATESGIAIGTNTRGLRNSIAIGRDALKNLNKAETETLTSENIAIGYGALQNLKMNGHNIAIGMYACSHVLGMNKVCIGDYSGPDSDSSKWSQENNYDEVIFLGNGRQYGKGLVFIPGNLQVMGTFTNPSDRRLKNVGKEFTSGLDKIRQLKVFNYTFKKDEKKTPRVGVIAQDLQKIFPNAVEKGGDGFLTIRMEDMFYALVNAVKELDAKVTAMVLDFAKQKEQLFSAQKDINALKKENKELKQALNKANNDNKKLEARLNAIEAKLK